MKAKRILILAFVLLFIFGAAVSIPNGFVNKWGPDSVYAGDDKDKDKDKDKKNVPEPTSLILLGAGLAAVGGYAALRFKKNKDNQ
jgi:hypothetical protein